MEDPRTRRQQWESWVRLREEKRWTSGGWQGEEPASEAKFGHIYPMMRALARLG